MTDPLPVILNADELKGPDDKLRILAKAVEQSPVSVIITDPKGVILYVNPKFTKLMGYTAEEAIGKTPRIIKGEHLTRAFYKEMWDTILSGQEWHGVFHNRTKSGTLVWEAASISPIRDDAGNVTHFVGVKEDITELKRLQEELDHQARHDPLTGLPNRLMFKDRLQQTLALARRHHTLAALLYLDLDGFKPINDTYGHDAGDLLLTEVGRRLQGCVRASDTVARMGGDEFTVLLNDVGSVEATRRVVATIAAALAEPVRLGSNEIHIAASIGVAHFPADGDVEDALLTAADSAMYVAKREGRAGCRFASGDPGPA